MRNLDKELDKVKSTVFLHKKYAAFLGSLMCSLEFIWSHDVQSAGTDGKRVYWNPDWFQTLSQETAASVLIHELWHVARLHSVRAENRNREVWNVACDYRINNDMEREGYKFTGTTPLIDHDYDTWGIKSEEQIYDELIQQFPEDTIKSNSWGQGEPDMIPLSKQESIEVIQSVVKAVQQAKLMNQAGNVPGDVVTLLDTILDPILPWDKLLHRFFTDMLNEDYTWRKPNRRHQDIYLPSRFTDDGRLEHLCYYFDVSGSVTDDDIIRFNSEVKYIQNSLNPKKLTIVQFDTQITKVTEYQEDEAYRPLEIHGRGGTSLRCVREHINATLPTAVVVFSDLDCAPMEPIKEEIPILWAIVRNPRVTVPFGTAIHID